MKTIAALLISLCLCGVAWGGEQTFYNYDTGKCEVIDAEIGNFENCIPQIPIARSLYKAYIIKGSKPIDAFIEVLERFYPTEVEYK